MGDCCGFGYGLINALDNHQISSNCFLHLDAIPSLKQVYFSSRLNEEIFLIAGNIILAHYFQSIALFEHARYHSSKGIERFVVSGIIKFDNVKQKWPIAFAFRS